MYTTIKSFKGVILVDEWEIVLYENYAQCSNVAKVLGALFTKLKKYVSSHLLIVYWLSEITCR